MKHDSVAAGEPRALPTGAGNRADKGGHRGGRAGLSAVAAKEIKDLIQDSVKGVEDGFGPVAQSEQTLEQIVSTVHAVIIPSTQE